MLIPDHWLGLPGRRPARRALPSNPISFIVQFKRPEYIASHAGKQWKLWRTPYYRFKIDSDQQRTLKRLEKNTAGEAIVRYAAPAFSTHQEMDLARLSEQVIASSGHVAPTVLSGHKVWTYVAAGSAGRPNPSGKDRPFDRLSDLFREPDEDEQADSPVTRTDIAAFDAMGFHIESLARTALSREPDLRRMVDAWHREVVRQDVGLATARAVANFAAVQSLLSRTGASWWVFDRNALI